MKPEFEIDFSDDIKVKKLDDLTFEKTKESYLEWASRDFEYLDIEIKDLLNMPPPANSSDETRKELLYIKEFPKYENSEHLAAHLKEMDESPEGFIYDYHEELTGEKIDLDDIRYKVIGDSNTLILKLKLHYGRPRPYQLAPYHNINIDYNESIQNNSAATPAYPSGHTASAFLAASICSLMYPDLQEKFMQRAKMVADSRIYEGVHFPSDNNFSVFIVRQVLVPAFAKKYLR
tara:strand:- start:12212 stop:12910 length:699 start_codon:yes stop_codon:yes gene_type:complete